MIFVYLLFEHTLDFIVFPACFVAWNSAGTVFPLLWICPVWMAMLQFSLWYTMFQSNHLTRKHKNSPLLWYIPAFAHALVILVVHMLFVWKFSSNSPLLLVSGLCIVLVDAFCGFVSTTKYATLHFEYFAKKHGPLEVVKTTQSKLKNIDFFKFFSNRCGGVEDDIVSGRVWICLHEVGRVRHFSLEISRPMFEIKHVEEFPYSPRINFSLGNAPGYVIFGKVFMVDIEVDGAQKILLLRDGYHYENFLKGLSQ